MTFKRVLNDPKTPGGTPGRTPDKHHPKIVDLATTIGEWLSNGLEEIEVLQHRGRAGFKSTDLRYVLDEGDETVDVEGVTVRGVNPLEFALSLFDDICTYADEWGAANFRVVGFREDGEGKTEQCFSFPLPKRILGDLPEIEDDPADENIGSMVAGWKKLTESAVSFNMKLHAAYLGLAQALPPITDANAKMLIANAGALGEQKPALELEIAKMERDRDRENAEVHARLRHHRQERNADLGRHAIDVLGPDIAAAIRIITERYAETLDSKATGGEEEPSEASEDAPPKAASVPSSPMAQRLNEAWSELDSEAIGHCRDILGFKIWDFLNSARTATTDEYFKSSIRLIDAELTELAAEDVAKMMTALAPHVGVNGVRVLAELLKESRA